MSSFVSDENAFAFGTVFKLSRAFIWKFHERWASQRLAIELNITERKNSIESYVSFNICQWLNENIPDRSASLPYLSFSFLSFPLLTGSFIRTRKYTLFVVKIWTYETHTYIHIFLYFTSTRVVDKIYRYINYSHRVCCTSWNHLSHKSQLTCFFSFFHRISQNFPLLIYRLISKKFYQCFFKNKEFHFNCD